MFALFRRVCLRAVVLASYCAFLGCGVGGHEPGLRTLIYFHVCIKFYILRSLPAHFFFATNCRRPGTNQWNINCSRISIIFHISFSPSKGASWCIFRYLARIFRPSDRSVVPYLPTAQKQACAESSLACLHSVERCVVRHRGLEETTSPCTPA